MGFLNTNLELSENDFVSHPELREQFKLILNSMLGKLAQKPLEEKHCSVSSYQELANISKNSRIVDIGTITDQFCDIGVKTKNNGEDNKGNCVVYAFITARARISLHQHMMALEAANFDLFYTDCDSIIFAGPKDKVIPLPQGIAFGDFKHELGENSRIKKFSCRGRKDFEITYQLETREERLVKVKGLALQSHIANTEYESQGECKAIPQLRRIKSRIQYQTFHICKKISAQRKMSKRDSLTLPWGFSCDKSL